MFVRYESGLCPRCYNDRLESQERVAPAQHASEQADG